jgi:hypothetical protein
LQNKLQLIKYMQLNRTSDNGSPKEELQTEERIYQTFKRNTGSLC